MFIILFDVTGIYGVPINIVSSCMFEATRHFCSRKRNLRFIILVDINMEALSAMNMKFQSAYVFQHISDDDVFNMFEPFMAAARDEWSSNIQRSGDAADSTAYKRKQIYANEAAARHSDAKENLFPDIFSSIHHKSKEKCSICLGYIEDAQSMKKCKHVFCRGCISEALSHKPVCPICGEIYGALRGNQPDGNMLVHKNPKLKLPGFKCGSIIIEYILPGGRQTVIPILHY